MDLRQQANNVANQGRYGDSMLLHVNPMEMKGLASAMPLTINPETGQPEAFLPFLAPLLGSVLGKALLGKTLGTVAASAIGSGLAQTAATGDVRKGLLAGLTGFGVGKFLDGISGAGAEIAGQEAAKTALQQSGVPLTGEVGKNIIAKAGAQNVADAATSAATTTSGNVLQNLSSQGTELANIFEPAISPNVKTDIFSSISQATGSPVQDIPNLLPSGLEVGAKSVMETLSDPMVYIPAGVGMGTTGQMITQEKFEKYFANAPEREKERIRQLMAMYPEAIPMQEGGFLNDPLIYEAGRALALDEINKRLRRQMSPEEKAAYERAFRLYGMNTESGMESRPGGAGGEGGGNNNQGNGQFGGGDDNPLIRRANPMPQGFMGGFAPEFSYFNNVNPSATNLEQGTSGQAGLGGQGRFMPQTGSGVQLANRDLSSNFYADAFANAIPDLSSEQKQQARDYAFQMRQGGDNQMPEFLQDKDFLKGFEAGNKVSSQVQANPNQFGIATPGQFSPTQTAGYRQFYGSSAIGVPQIIDPNAATQGFSVSPFTPSALPPPMAPPPSTGTGSDQDTGQDGGQRGEEDTDTGQGDQTKDETRDAGTETRFLPDLTRDEFDLMMQGREDFADVRKRFENILGIPERETPVEETPVVDTPDYAQQLADQAELIQQLQEQIASNQEAITGIPQFDPSTINFSDIQDVPDFATTDQLFDPSNLDLSGFATTDDLSTAISGIPSFDASGLQSDISGLQTGLEGLQGQFQGFTPFDPTAIQNQISSLQQSQPANLYADAFANAIPDLTPEERQQAKSYAFNLELGGDSRMPEFLQNKDFLKGFEAGNEARSASQPTINFSDIQGVPDFSQFATTDQLFDPSTFDFSNVDFSGVDFGFDPSQFATTEDLSTAISDVPQFDPSTLDLSGFATTDDLSTAISGIPQFDPSSLGLPDFSQFATTQDLSTAISGVPQFDASNILSQLSDLQTGQTGFAQDLGNLQGQFSGFTPSPTTINFSEIQGAPDFSQFATQDDLSTAISGVPQFDPSTLGLPDFSQFATQDQLFDPSTFDFSGVDFGFDPSNFATTEDLSTAISGVPQFDPSSLGLPDFSQFATTDDLSSAVSGIPQFDPSSLNLPDFSQFATQDQLFDPSNLDFSGFATTQDLSSAISGVPQFDPTTINFSDIQGTPDFSNFATQNQLFDPSTFDFSGVDFGFDPSQFATTDQLFDPSTLDFSDFATTDDLSTAISGVPQFDPTTINFSDIQGTPDFSNFATYSQTKDNLMQDLATPGSRFRAGVTGAVSASLPDFSQYATTDQLFDPSQSGFLTSNDLTNLFTQRDSRSIAFDSPYAALEKSLMNRFNKARQYSNYNPIGDQQNRLRDLYKAFTPTTALGSPIDFSQFATTDQLFDPSQYEFLTSNDLTNLFTVGNPSAVSYDSPYAALEKSLMSRFDKARQFADTTPIGGQQTRLKDLYNTFTPSPTTINFSDIQGVPDFSDFATTDQLFDPNTLDFSGFATTDQLFDPSTLQSQIDSLQSLAETYGTTGTPGPQTTTSSKSAPAVGRSDGGSLKTVPEDNKGLSKLPEDVRNKMGYMNEGGLTESMLADPLTNQVAQFILGNETNDEVISAFIEKYGPTSFRELRRAVLKTLAPNAQTEGMIKGSLAGGMKDDIFGVIGDPEKNGQRVAVSQDEFIVPADVVSMLGDGSSDAGANKLYNMMKRIREEKTATTKQARPINDNKVMPA